MALINSQVLKVARNEVQEEIDQRVNVFKALHPQESLVRLSSSDAMLPLTPGVVKAMSQSVQEMGVNADAKGIAPIKGYPFLLDAIVKNDFKRRKLKITTEDIFVNTGTKQDISGIGDILCKDNRISVLDPISQTYVESNVIGYRAGILEKNHRWSNVVYLTINKGNHYTPAFPAERPDVVFLSYPNNPTGMAITREALTQWVNYALENKVVILFDATYEAFVSEDDIPHSIYEIKDARKVAIEFHSFAKSAGFTGLHCGYTVIPKEVKGYSLNYGKHVLLNELWAQRQSVKNNAPPYLLQRAAEALYTPAGKRETQANVEYYMTNAAMLRRALQEAGIAFCGGVNSPYLWVQSPTGNSWKLFDKLLYECRIVSVPGEMYGGNPDACVRLSAFADQDDVIKACSRIAQQLR
ncbi:LL-diaminopimelate aminotransferase [Bacteroidia bacterium]|nr:LL-diaminopimelate aminotransferase [Bacteroidia bacterium]